MAVNMKKRSSSETGSEKYEAVRSLQDNFDNLAVLQHEHRQKFEAVELEFNQLTKFKEDYVHLQKRLKTLPDKTSHEVMVPFGPLAFMPGRLIHTNEILVLLGDNWFAERSAKEAGEIVRRRVKDCDEKIKTAETRMNIHKTWLKETSSLFEEKGQVEIIEELTEEDFERSKEVHRQKVAEEYEKKRQDKQCNELPSDSTASCTSDDKFVHKLGVSDKNAYESLMRRLDQLEIEEDKESTGSEDTDDSDGECIRDSEIPEDVDMGAEGAALTAGTGEGASSTTQDPVKPKKKLKRRVSWADDKRPLHTVIPEEASDCTYRIKYTTRQLSLPLIEGDPSTSETPEEDDEGDTASAAIIQSPSDIYKVFGGRRRSSLQETPPRGILKKTSSDPESQTGAEGGWNFRDKSSQDFMDSSTDVNSAQPSEIPSPKEESLEAAFSYKILERNVDPESSQPVPMAASSTDAQNKKISRFKAARMKK